MRKAETGEAVVASSVLEFQWVPKARGGIAKTESIQFESYQALATRFHEEAMELWRKEDEQR